MRSRCVRLRSTLISLAPKKKASREQSAVICSRPHEQHSSSKRSPSAIRPSAQPQGSRPTCLAFAASDTHAALRGPWAPLSCEYLFYHAQRRTSRSPTQGALPTAILAALRENGQPEENRWPYQPTVSSDEVLVAASGWYLTCLRSKWSREKGVD